MWWCQWCQCICASPNTFCKLRNNSETAYILDCWSLQPLLTQKLVSAATLPKCNESRRLQENGGETDACHWSLGFCWEAKFQEERLGRTWAHQSDGWIPMLSHPQPPPLLTSPSKPSITNHITKHRQGNGMLLWLSVTLVPSFLHQRLRSGWCMCTRSHTAYSVSIIQSFKNMLTY